MTIYFKGFLVFSFNVPISWSEKGASEILTFNNFLFTNMVDSFLSTSSLDEDQTLTHVIISLSSRDENAVKQSSFLSSLIDILFFKKEVYEEL